MTTKKISIIALYCSIYGALFANKTEVVVDSLTENAVSIVRNHSAEFVQTDINNATYNVTRKIGILAKAGDSHGDFGASYDNFSELKDFSGIITDAQGKVIKKIAKKDLRTSSISEQMASDAYSMTYEFKSPSYPCTVEYTYQEQWKNGIIAYPRFSPMQAYGQSVEKAEHTISIPNKMNVRHYSNFESKVSCIHSNNQAIYTFSTNAIKAIQDEELAPPVRESIPTVLIAPSDFCFDKVCGNMDTWENYGKWVFNLLKNRDSLPNELSNKLIAMTENASNDREKVEIIYKFLQENSRYVSIQLGIGGFQPIQATSVYETKFGDCKGLTNLMKAMLKAVNIPSNYCEIYLGKQKNLLPEFSNISQTNHAILLVPLKNDSLWLECTSQTLPAGYIHDGIAGHNALVVTDDGGKLCRLPSYKYDLNKKESKLLLTISEDGKANGNFSFTEQLHGYSDNHQTINSNDREKQVKYINNNIYLPKIKIGEISASENKSSMPSCVLSGGLEVDDFINKTGNRMFIPVCPLKKEVFTLFTSNTRNLDIYIGDGFSETDSITINIPASYTIESLPKNISLETSFGSFTTSAVQTDGNKISYTQQIDLFAGRYNKSEYKQIKDFFSQISTATKRKLVVKKSM